MKSLYLLIQQKLINLIIVLGVLFSTQSAYGQDSLKTQEKYKIVNISKSIDDKGFPLINFTILNTDSKAVIFTKIELELIKFTTNGAMSIPESKELKPIAYWDLNIPLDEGKYLFGTKYPVQIASDDAGTIQVRIYRGFRGKKLTPDQCGLFEFKLRFISHENIKVITPELSVGSR